MKILLDIKEEKAAFILELLSNFQYVKARPISSQKAAALEGLQEAIAEVAAIKAGKKGAKTLDAFLDAL